MSYTDISSKLTLRPRRLRKSSLIRDLVADVSLSERELIMPIFLTYGEQIKQPVISMPNVYQMSPDVAIQELEYLKSKGVCNFLLFGVVPPELKSPTGEVALSEKNPVIQFLKQSATLRKDCLVIADLCYCEYTSHGHCGVLCEDPSMVVDNDLSILNLANQALALAEAGADIIAPSASLDGMVKAIRGTLDNNGFSNTPILSYTVKYASSLYGPFRDAAMGAPQFGDRKGYQMDYRRTNEWLTEVKLDESEGADILMVKPAGFYLDIISKLSQSSSLPIAAYQVSGEYSQIHSASQMGWLDLKTTALESLFAIKRAGASLICSYFAPEVKAWLSE